MVSTEPVATQTDLLHQGDPIDDDKLCDDQSQLEG
jgi:hypothetical protein